MCSVGLTVNICMDGCMREMKAKREKNRCKTEAEWSGLVSNCMKACMRGVVWELMQMG